MQQYPSKCHKRPANASIPTGWPSKNRVYQERASRPCPRRCAHPPLSQRPPHRVSYHWVRPDCILNQPLPDPPSQLLHHTFIPHERCHLERQQPPRLDIRTLCRLLESDQLLWIYTSGRGCRGSGRWSEERLQLGDGDKEREDGFAG